MTQTNPRKAQRPSLSLTWLPLAAVLALTAYVAGVALARRWAAGPASPSPPAPAPTEVLADWLAPGEPVEGTLGDESRNEYVFLGRGGQVATVEMWFHPGSGSNVDGELAVQLLAPDGRVLASESGDVFLPPYLVAPLLPDTGSYRVRVTPTAGAPGRYSFVLSLSQPSTAGTPVTPLPPAAGPSAGDDTAVVQGMFQWPSVRREISGWTFHDPGNPAHAGLDIAAAMHDRIVAVADGLVVFSGWGGGYGNLVIVEHNADWISYYAHLNEFAVAVGDVVRGGEVLGGAGTTGYSTGPHLHFELRYRGRPVDPHVYLP